MDARQFNPKQFESRPGKQKWSRIRQLFSYLSGQRGREQLDAANIRRPLNCRFTLRATSKVYGSNQFVSETKR